MESFIWIFVVTSKLDERLIDFCLPKVSFFAYLHLPKTFTAVLLFIFTHNISDVLIVKCKYVLFTIFNFNVIHSWVALCYETNLSGYSCMKINYTVFIYLYLFTEHLWLKFVTSLRRHHLLGLKGLTRRDTLI